MGMNDVETAALTIQAILLEEPEMVSNNLGPEPAGADIHEQGFG